MAEVSGLKKDKIQASGTTYNEPARLADLPPNDAAVKIHAAAPRAIVGTEQPQAWDQLKDGKITLPPASAMAVEKAASDVGIGTEKRMPDFAFAVIKIAMDREQFGSQKLKLMAEQVKEQLGDVDCLLDLSSELTSLPDKDSHDLTDKMRGLIGRLEVHKIQIWKGDGKISKEKLNEMKAQIGSQIDKLRTAIQTKISTEIQPEANNLQSIMNIVQQIIQSDARLKRKTAEVPR